MDQNKDQLACRSSRFVHYLMQEKEEVKQAGRQMKKVTIGSSCEPAVCCWFRAPSVSDHTSHGHLISALVILF